MLIQNECVGCIINQSKRVADALGASSTLSQKLTSHVEMMSKDFSFKLSPPEIAADVYAQMAQIANKADLYKEVKELSTQKALSFIPFLKEKLFTCENKLLTATKIAVAGNVIDLAAQVEFDLHEELEKLFERDFAHNDFEKFSQELSTAKNIVYLADNAGEHIFDYLFIQTLLELFSDLHISYVVRGCPIINDVTYNEALEAGFDSLCSLVDSGVNTPGFAYSRANKETQELFDSADLVISKGMGNYECLFPSHKQNICFLLKVKCNVVANSLGQDLGALVCKMV